MSDHEKAGGPFTDVPPHLFIRPEVFQDHRAALWAQFAAAAASGLYASYQENSRTYSEEAAISADALLSEYDKRFGGGE